MMRKHLLRNLTLLGVVLTLCVGFASVGYGHWSETLHIDGWAQWNDLYIEIVEQETNDPWKHDFDDGDWVLDPDTGQYYYTGVLGADESILDGFQGNPFRLWKDVGRTDCVLVDTDEDGYRDTCQFFIYDAYPSYFGKLTLRIKNEGSAYVQVDSVDVNYTGFEGEYYARYDDPENPPYTGGTCNFSSPDIMTPPWPHPDEFEVQWTNGAWNLPIKIAPGQQTYLGCEVHVLQPAVPGTTYNFTITFHFSGPVTP
jgi:hypothetical protein